MNRAERRKVDYHHAIRKKKKSDWQECVFIGTETTSDTAVFDGTVQQRSMYDNLHQYSKNKIHCSCPMCSAKSGVSNSVRNYTAADRRKIERQECEMLEYNECV